MLIFFNMSLQNAFKITTEIKIKNLNGPALSSHAERTGAEVDFFKHGGCVVKCLTTHLDIDVSVS